MAAAARDSERIQLTVRAYSTGLGTVVTKRAFLDLRRMLALLLPSPIIVLLQRAARAPNGLAPVAVLDVLLRIAALLSRSRAYSPLPPSRLALLATRRPGSVRQTVRCSRCLL